MIEVNDLWKRYGGRWVLQNITMTVNKGSVTAVLGKNGAGKSTLFRIMAGVTRASRGSVAIGGLPLGKRAKERIAYLPDIDFFYGGMRIGELCVFLSRFYSHWQADKASSLLRLMELAPEAKIKTLSKGEKARLKLVTAFARDFDLMLLDEPFMGIDQSSRRKIRDVLFDELRFPEQTVLISTHLIGEIEHLVDEFATANVPSRYF